MTERLMTTKQVADRLGVTPRTVLNAVGRGDLLARLDTGRLKRYHPDDVRAYEERRCRPHKRCAPSNVPELPAALRWVPGFVGRYAVSADGGVWSYTRGRALPLKVQVHSRNGGNYMAHTVGLSAGGVKTTAMVARLVLLAWVGPPPDEGCQADHIDHDPSNNTVSNLQWLSQADNLARRRPEEIARGEGHGRSKLTRAQVVGIRDRCAAGDSTRAVARDFGVSRTTVRNIVAGRTWAHVL